MQQTSNWTFGGNVTWTRRIAYRPDEAEAAIRYWSTGDDEEANDGEDDDDYDDGVHLHLFNK